MIGTLVHGQSAPKGTLMLGEIDIKGRKQRVLATPVRLNAEPHCLIVPMTGNAFVPSSAWIRRTMWDVTGNVEFIVDYGKFCISADAPRHGEIAHHDGDWLIAAQTNEHSAEHVDWINVAIGEPAQVRADLLRFPGWKLCHRSNTDDLITLFQPSGPQAEPRIRSLA